MPPFGAVKRASRHPHLGLDPAAHLQRCRELASQRYRMVSLSAVRVSADGPLISTSVWHRPVISEQAKDQLAERQARAAVALIHMGKAGVVWPLLRTRRSPAEELYHQLAEPPRADPGMVAAEFARFSAGAKAVGRIANPSDEPDGGLSVHHSPDRMDTILFHPENSIRRALILALGTYNTNALSRRDRDPLTILLRDLYTNDPDSGIHSEAEWTLRRWNEHAKLKAADEKLTQLKDRGDRRWFINSQGQTFALIEGPVEFRMGSPPTEPGRDSDEVWHRRLIRAALPSLPRR